jgi:hypothetical protein
MERTLDNPESKAHHKETKKKIKHTKNRKKQKLQRAEEEAITKRTRAKWPKRLQLKHFGGNSSRPRFLERFASLASSTRMTEP